MTLFAIASLVVAFPSDGARLPAVENCYVIGATRPGVTNVVVAGKNVPVYKTGAWSTLVPVEEGTKISFRAKSVETKENLDREIRDRLEEALGHMIEQKRGLPVVDKNAQTDPKEEKKQLLRAVNKETAVYYYRLLRSGKGRILQSGTRKVCSGSADSGTSGTAAGNFSSCVRIF